MRRFSITEKTIKGVKYILLKDIRNSFCNNISYLLEEEFEDLFSVLYNYKIDSFREEMEISKNRDCSPKELLEVEEKISKE